MKPEVHQKYSNLSYTDILEEKKRRNTHDGVIYLHLVVHELLINAKPFLM